jgi:hypothetical protein
MALLGVFLFVLVGVLGGVEDRTVRQHSPSLDRAGGDSARERRRTDQ